MLDLGKFSQEHNHFVPRGSVLLEWLSHRFKSSDFPNFIRAHIERLAGVPQQSQQQAQALENTYYDDQIAAEDNLVFYDRQKNLDRMSMILCEHRHYIYLNITLPSAWVVGEMIAAHVPTHQRGANILEVGTGNGVTTRILHSAVEYSGVSVRHYTCLDPFPSALQTTKAKIEEEIPEDQEKFKYIQSPLQNPHLLSEIDKPVGGYDGIAGIFSLNYAATLREFKQGLQNVRGLLAHNGVAFFLGNVYNPADWQNGGFIDQSSHGVTFRMLDASREPYKITVQLNSMLDHTIKSEEFSNYIMSPAMIEHIASRADLRASIIEPRTMFHNDPYAQLLNPICRLIMLRAA